MVEKMNEFKLLGRVGNVEINYSERTGKPCTKISIGVPNGKKNDEGKSLYDNYYVTFFNSEKSPTAENLAEYVKEGDYVRVAGKLSINKYKKNPDDEKFTYSMQLIGFGYKKVKFDDVTRKYVDIEDTKTSG